MKSYFLCVLFLLAGAEASANPHWENPSEKYMEAYKDYLNASCPIAKDEIKHFVYFARDRASLRNHSLLEHKRFSGAQIMYAWTQLEPSQGKYDFSAIEEDYLYLKKNGKTLFVQLQDATFDTRYHAVPKYLMNAEFGGGETAQYTDTGKPEGWVAKRWHPKVQQRFAKLLAELGKHFDGKIVGINLQESSIGVTNKTDESFTPEKYAQGLQINMLALKKAFPKSVTMQYANFMPGEWLPWEDEGYLKSIYRYGQEIGVGLGAPDLMVKRKGQLNHAIAMMHENSYNVPLGIAVQDGNYIGVTGSQKAAKTDGNIVPLLHAFAKDFMRVDYMFWVNQKPYFERDVLSCF